MVGEMLTRNGKIYVWLMVTRYVVELFCSDVERKKVRRNNVFSRDMSSVSDLAGFDYFNLL